MTEAISWLINIIAVIGWTVNIKHRKYAMWIFTISTILSIPYFLSTDQIPFTIRSIFYLFVDVATLIQIYKHETKKAALEEK